MILLCRRCASKRHSRNRHGAVILHGKCAARKSLLGLSSVACNVAQSLLRDAKEAQCHVLRQCTGNVPRVHLQSNWTLREAARTRLSTLRSSRGLRGWRDGGDTKGMHVLAQSNRPFSHRSHGGASGRAGAALVATGVDRQRGQAARSHRRASHAQGARAPPPAR
jgi:hypothetical protein